MSENNLSKTLEIKDLSIEFRTRNRTVYAVNHLDMEIKKRTDAGSCGRDRCRKNNYRVGNFRFDFISSRGDYLRKNFC